MDEMLLDFRSSGERWLMNSKPSATKKRLVEGTKRSRLLKLQPCKPSWLRLTKRQQSALTAKAMLESSSMQEVFYWLST